MLFRVEFNVYLPLMPLDRMLHRSIFEMAYENRNYFYRNSTFSMPFCNERFSFSFDLCTYAKNQLKQQQIWKQNRHGHVRNQRMWQLAVKQAAACSCRIHSEMSKSAFECYHRMWVVNSSMLACADSLRKSRRREKRRKAVDDLHSPTGSLNGRSWGVLYLYTSESHYTELGRRSSSLVEIRQNFAIAFSALRCPFE